MEAIIQSSDSVIKYFTEDLHLAEYFLPDTSHVKSTGYNLNLWRVSPEHILTYSAHVSEYLGKTYFRHKDMSTLKVVLDELYANIADHSQTGDVAYSFIKYSAPEKLIKVAFCDFGIGIKGSLQKGGVTPVAIAI